MIGKMASAAMAAMMLCATSAHALEKCGVRIDKKTGVLAVSASGVSGTLHWGSSEGAETGTFFNAGTCIADGKASKCQIADPATLAAKTPPSGCTLYLDDDGTPCSAWIAGCTPGERSPGVCVKDPSATPRFVDNGDGTISDKATCLMWEKKTGPLNEMVISECPGAPTCGSLHDVNNQYVWSTGAPYNPDGPAFFSFLAALNGPSPFAGHDDWRMPTITELQSIVDCSGGGRCNDPIFGPTGFVYWSSSTDQSSPDNAWGVIFGYGETLQFPKTSPTTVRAVRTES